MEIIINALNAFLATFFIILVPPLLSCIAVVEFTRKMMKSEPEYRNWLKDRELIKYVFSLHPNKGLSSQGPFWLSIITPLFYFLMLGPFAWNGYTPRLDAEGFKTFISISALPLGVLSLALPLSVSVARFHSSKQTARQIEIVSQKNNVDLFHAHRKELFSYFSQIGETKYSNVLIAKNHIHPRVHKSFFTGKPEDGSPKANESAFNEIRRDIDSLMFLLDAVLKNINKEMTFQFYLFNFCPQVYSTALKLGLEEVVHSFRETSVESRSIVNGRKYWTVGNSSEDAVLALRYINNFYMNLCDFSGHSQDEGSSQEEYSYFMSNNDFKNQRLDVIKLIISSMITDNNLKRAENTILVLP